MDDDDLLDTRKKKGRGLFRPKDAIREFKGKNLATDRENSDTHVGSEVFATVNVNIMVMCYIILCNVVNMNQSRQFSALKMEAAGCSEIGTHLLNSTTIHSRRS